MSLSRSVIGFAAALALAGALVPAFASAQTAPYYSGCGTSYSTTYPYNYPYSNYYQNSYCPPHGTLFVYVQVQAPVNSYYGRQPGDFTISVSGGNAYPATVQGSPNGQLISLLGSYSVTALSFQGFTASYSSGCAGSVAQGQQASCVITETPIYPSGYYQNQYPGQYSGQYPYFNQSYTNGYTSPIAYVTPTYVPRLPNTGFEPQNALALALLVILIATASFSLPYVRKTLAVIIG